MSKKRNQSGSGRQVDPPGAGGNGHRSVSSPPVFREAPEPTAEKRPLPIWLLVLLFILLYWGDMYIMNNGADLAGEAGAFPVVVYDPFQSYSDLALANPVSPEQEARNKGIQVYNFVCIQCHQGNGMGLPGQFPPLAGSEWLTEPTAAKAVRIVLNGLSGPIQVKGASFNNSMPPWKGTLNDQQVAHVLSFVRQEWGNNASPVTPEEVAKVREQLKLRQAPFTAPELQALVVEAPAPAPQAK